jgi:hypothetical protein
VLNVQPAGGGKAKMYRVKQLLRGIDEDGLVLEDEA